MIDSVTSRYPSKQALLNRIGDVVTSKRKPIDVFIMYRQAQRGFETDRKTHLPKREKSIFVAVLVPKAVPEFGRLSTCL